MRKTTIPIGALRHYYALSERIRPIPPGPALDTTWWEHSGDAVGHDIDPPGWDTEAVDLWLDLAELIAQNEPRFLRQVGYPDSYVERLRDVLNSVPDAEIDAYADPDYSRDAHQQEIDRLEPLAEMLTRTAGRVEGIRDDAEDAAHSVQTRIEELQSAMDRLPDEEEEVDHWSSTSRSDDEEFDIDKVFADL